MTLNQLSKLIVIICLIFVCILSYPNIKDQISSDPQIQIITKDANTHHPEQYTCGLLGVNNDYVFTKPVGDKIQILHNGIDVGVFPQEDIIIKIVAPPFSTEVFGVRCLVSKQ